VKTIRMRAAAAGLVLTLIGAARIVSTYGVFSHTADEPDHLAAGMQWIDTHKYTYEDQHPPLARVFGAIGPYFAGERWNRESDAYGEGYRILGFGQHYDRVLSLGRLGILPFFFLASAVVFLWGHRAGGEWGALLSTLLFTTLPPVLAHSGLLTTDMAAAACTGAAALAALYWMDNQSSPRAILLGVCIGLAALAKFSCLVFLPAAWFLMYAVHRGPIRWRSLGSILGTAILIVWAGYNFSFAPVEFLHVRLPAPRFFLGLEAVWRHNQEGHLSYLLGQRSMNGFWYYFPVVLAVKTPLALLVLTIWAAWTSPRRHELLLPLAFTIGILIVASFSRINIGVRHILPVYSGMCIAGGVVAAQTRWRAAAVALIAWHVLVGAWHHPDYLAYTNELAGNHPEEWVVDSDLDWGQDMNRLEDRLRRAEAREFAFTPFNQSYSTRTGHILPLITPLDPEVPSPGWNAVSVTIWKLYNVPHWANHPPSPPERVGRSILLWHFPAAQD
jgi:hypothetical protein